MFFKHSNKSQPTKKNLLKTLKSIHPKPPFSTFPLSPKPLSFWKGGGGTESIPTGSTCVFSKVNRKVALENLVILPPNAIADDVLEQVTRETVWISGGGKFPTHRGDGGFLKRETGGEGQIFFNSLEVFCLFMK